MDEVSMIGRDLAKLSSRLRGVAALAARGPKDRAGLSRLCRGRGGDGDTLAGDVRQVARNGGGHAGRVG